MLDLDMHQPWPVTAEPPQLAADEVHVWSMRLDDASTAWMSLLAMLAVDERQRAERFRLDDARRRFVVARAWLRKLLGGYLRLPPDEVAFQYDEHGKPRLKHAASPPDFEFNLAHSGELALVALTRGCEVGVDVERLRDVHHWREIAERFFDPREVAEIDALPPAEQLAAFMRCWTGKEAVLKALGVGVTRPLDFFVGSSCSPDGNWVDVPTANAPARCRLHALAPATEYLGAVACLDAERVPQCFSVA